MKICPRGNCHPAGTAALWMTPRLATWPAGSHDGRADAWQALYDAFAERAAAGRSAQLIGPNSADVADIVQETMLAAARSARTYDGTKGSLWLWLWGIARLQSRLHFANSSGTIGSSTRASWLAASDGRLSRWLDGVDPTPTSLLETAELATIVRTTLTDLPSDYESLLTASISKANRSP